MSSMLADKVRDIKANKSLMLNGINYGRVIAIKVYDSSIKAIIKELLRLFCFGFLCEIGGNTKSDKCLIYSLRSANRRDYDEIIALFLKYNPDFKLIDLIQIKSIEKLHIKLMLLIKYSFYYLVKKVEEPFLSAIVTTQYVMLQKKMEENPVWEGIKLLVTFCDAHPPDNLLTQMAQKNNIVTATLQHGQYRILKKGNENADAEAYENFISDYMLTWGQATIDEFSRAGISADRLIKTGALRKFSFNNRIKSSLDKKTFGVVLCGEPYRETNIAMIKLANDFSIKHGLKFYLRMHPRNPVDYYLKYANNSVLYGHSNAISDDDYAKIVDFSLIHMTGVFVELLSINSPIVMYKDSLLEQMFHIDPYCIKDTESLSLFYENLLTNTERVLEDQYTRYHYFNEPSSQISSNYRKSIIEILEMRDKSN